MRTRSRVLFALAAATVLHAVLALFAARASVHARSAPSSSPVTIALLPRASLVAPLPGARAPFEAASSAARASTPLAPSMSAAVPPDAPLPRDADGADVAARAGTSTPDAASADRAAPDASSAAGPATASSSDARGPRAGRSLLERVVEGASAGPQPSIDTLDPARRRVGHDESDAARAKRFIDRIARVDALPRDAGPSHIELTPTESGGYTYSTGGFTAEIHDDGSVTFTDKTGKTALFGDASRPDPHAPYGGGIPTAPLGDPKRDNATMVNGSLSEQLDTMAPSTDLASGTFDLTAAIMRARGQDPYFAERSCFLDDTAELRADLRQKHELRQIADLRRALERAWFDDAKSAPERRAALFAMWDDCRDAGDDSTGIGARARQLVLSFVRQHLPRGSRDAFSDEELDSLNAHRASVPEFRPYG